MNSGRKRAPPRRSDTSSSLALATGMPESSSLLMVKERVSEVSQSGLTQEEPALLVLVGLEFEAEFLSVEDLMVRK